MAQKKETKEQKPGKEKGQTPGKEQENYRGFFSTGRLVIGIVSIPLAVWIFFQATAVGTLNLAAGSSDSGGPAGMFVALVFLVAGICAIVTRNYPFKNTAFAVCVLYAFNGVIAMLNSEVFEDLRIWGFLSILFALVFFTVGIQTKKV